MAAEWLIILLVEETGPDFAPIFVGLVLLAALAVQFFRGR